MILNERKKTLLKEMGIDLWVKKVCKTTTKDLFEELEKKVASCKLCALHKTRNNVVFDDGSKQAHVMFIGEAPGVSEDLQGKPFVGRAGMLLNSMLQSIGLARCDIYIANILKCRPPGNRDPQPQERKVCTPYLQQQITLVKPKLLVALGRIAAQFLLNSSEPMNKMQGNIYDYVQNQKTTPLLVTYHPAYLLRSPSEKSKSYADFLLIKKIISKNCRLICKTQYVK